MKTRQKKNLRINKRSIDRTKKAESKNFNPIFFRLILVWSFLLVVSIGIVGRLYYLQVIDPVIKYEQARKGIRLSKIAESQQMTNLKLYKPRRQIVDKQQNVLAVDRITHTLYVHPNRFKKHGLEIPPRQIAKELANILKNKTETELINIFSKHNSGILLAKNLPESVEEKIRRLQIDGLDLRTQYSRFYPHQEMVAEVIGYLRESDRKPQAGIEYTQDKLLERQSVNLKMRRSFSTVNGKTKSVYHPGQLSSSDKLFEFDDLQLKLTIDLRLQQAARRALKAKMEEYDATRGAVIVMDVRNGEIPVLVCEPTYNPNKYGEYGDYSLFKNWAITDLYEPGSTFKPINIAIALDAKVIEPNEIIDDTGTMEIGDRTVSNHDYEKEGARGDLSIPEILQYSSNVAMIKIMNRLDPQKYYQKLRELGIDSKLELEIPWSTAGQLKDEVEFRVREIEPATAAFGQGFSLTPMKLVQLHAAIANGGKLVSPHVVKGLSDFEGYLHYALPLNSQQIFNPSTTRIVLKMMETVVDRGSGIKAKIPGYRIAGKTGTAEKINRTGEYDENAKITSFISAFPVENPRYVVLAVVDEPKEIGSFGSTVAAPIARDVMEAIIATEGIAPSKMKTEGRGY